MWGFFIDMSSSRDVSISTYIESFPKTSFRKLHDAGGSRISMHYLMVGLTPPSQKTTKKNDMIDRRLFSKSETTVKAAAEPFVVHTHYYYD